MCAWQWPYCLSRMQLKNCCNLCSRIKATRGVRTSSQLFCNRSYFSLQKLEAVWSLQSWVCRWKVRLFCVFAKVMIVAAKYRFYSCKHTSQASPWDPGFQWYLKYMLLCWVICYHHHYLLLLLLAVISIARYLTHSPRFTRWTNHTWGRTKNLLQTSLLRTSEISLAALYSKLLETSQAPPA